MASALHLDTQASRSFSECGFAPFENLADQTPDLGVFETSAPIGDLRQLARSMRAAGCHDDLIGVGVDDKVSIMGDDNDLPALFGASKALD